MQSVQPEAKGGAAAYKHVAVADLPEGLTAGGIRPGGCNTLACAMPVEIVVHTTGHELKGLTSMAEYIDANLAACMPGYIVLAGFPPLPWGQLGKGPSAPSLDVLTGPGATVSWATGMRNVINGLFQLDTASPPALYDADGRLRPLVHAAFAAIVMYHGERLAAGEMRSVGSKLEALVRRFLAGGGDARETILKWGRDIAAKFKADNARLYARSADVGAVQLAEAVQSLGTLVGELRGEVAQLKEEVRSLKSTAGAAERGDECSASPAPPPAMRCGKKRTSPAVATADTAAAAATADADADADAAFSSPVAPAPASAAPAANPPPSGPLMPTTDAEGKQPKLSDLDAPTIFLKYMEQRRSWPGLTKQQKPKLNTLTAWFEEAATVEEKRVLLAGGESGCRRTIAEALNHVVRRRLASEFKKRTNEVPPALRKGKILKFTTILTKLEELNPTLTLDDADLPTFREQVCSRSSAQRSALTL